MNENEQMDETSREMFVAMLESILSDGMEEDVEGGTLTASIGQNPHQKLSSLRDYDPVMEVVTIDGREVEVTGLMKVLGHNLVGSLLGHPMPEGQHGEMLKQISLAKVARMPDVPDYEPHSEPWVDLLSPISKDVIGDVMAWVGHCIANDIEVSEHADVGMRHAARASFLGFIERVKNGEAKQGEVSRILAAYTASRMGLQAGLGDDFDAPGYL